MGELYEELAKKILQGDEASYQEALSQLDEMFKDGSAYIQLTPEQEKEWRASARANHMPGDSINPLWHPVYRDECARIDLESWRKKACLEK